MPIRKHVTELALGFYSGGLLIVHPKDIATIDSQSDAIRNLAVNCHIYLIVTRPRVSFVPGSIEMGETHTTGHLRYVKDGIARETKFQLDGKPSADELQISEYPHHKLSGIRDGQDVFIIPAHLLSLMCDRIDDLTLRDLEVVYVGMSYADGKRSAKDRLMSHSTLQQVLADLSGDTPDSEALVIMVSYEAPQTFVSIDGRQKSLRIDDDRDALADLKRLETEITEDLRVRLIEASLIRYFQPRYNEKYKDRFPLPTQRILKELYEIDFGALAVEINTEQIKSRLYSTARSAGFHHIASVDLHDPTLRLSFFNTMNVEFASDANDFSGPML